MSQIRCDDRQTISRLYERFAQAAVRKCLRIVRNQQIAEEIVQEVFLKVWQGKQVFDDETHFYKWVYRSCHNAAIDRLRLAYNSKKQDVAAEIDAVPDVFEPTNHLENREFLEKLFGILKQEESELLYHIIVDGMTQIEVAELLGVDRKTVYRQLVKINTKLQKWRLALGA